MFTQPLPDFAEPLRLAEAEVFYSPVGGHRYFLLPDALEIAPLPDGRPDFILELVASNAGAALKTYSVLDFKLRARFRTDEALNELRRRDALAILTPMSFAQGFLHFLPAGAAFDFPAELKRPLPLAWNELGATRFVLRLSADTGALLCQALQSEMLLLTAGAELEMLGIAPRLPVRVRFTPAQLLEPLRALADAEQRITDEQVSAFFARDWATLPLEIVSGNASQQSDAARRLFAEAMTDRVRMQFGRFVAAPFTAEGGWHKPLFAWRKPEEISAKTSEWDLAEDACVRRTYRLSLPPLEAARRVVKAQGLSALVRQTTVPPLPTGSHSISIRANLPATERVGLVAAGITLRVPPKPPLRPQAITSTARFRAPEEAVQLTLRLAPKEALEYTYTTHAILQLGAMVKQIEAAPVTQTASWLGLARPDFPVEFVFLEASATLLELATVTGVCRGVVGAESFAQSFRLEANRTSIALALPPAALAHATLEFEAQERNGTGRLQLGPMPVNDLWLDLASFAEYGPQEVDITCEFGASTSSHSIELWPENRPATADEITRLSFTRATPQRRWSWFAASPFRAGYRYRLLRRSNEPPASWSELQPRAVPLRIIAGGQA